MPHFTILIEPQGPLLAVILNPVAARRAALQAEGKPIPVPQTCRLLVDTGASGCALDTSIIAALGLEAKGEQEIHTPSTKGIPVKCATYDVELLIPTGTNVPNKLIPALEVIEGHFLAQGHHGLLGRNALSDCRIIYSGPDRAMMLSF